MPAIVYQTNKKTGVTYAYESVSHWDKVKQQSRARRKCIGRVDTETKEIIPTRKKAEPAVTEKDRRGPVPITRSSRCFYGATYLFDQIGKETGVTEDLKACFPESYRQILSLAYYLILEDRNPLSRFPRWASIHRHPYGAVIPSQRSSELLASITEEARQRFFLLQGKRRIEREYGLRHHVYIQLFKELTAGPLWSQQGTRPLEQINPALLFGQQSRLPFYYRKLAGSIPDVKTLRKLLADVKTRATRRSRLSWTGLFSAANINDMYHHHMKFLIAARLSLKIVQTNLDAVRRRCGTGLITIRNISSTPLPCRLPGLCSGPPL